MTMYTESLTSIVSVKLTKSSSWSAWYWASASMEAIMSAVACPVSFWPITEKRLCSCLLDGIRSFWSTKAFLLTVPTEA